MLVMSPIRNLIWAVRVLWLTRRGPCLHPVYCCQLPPRERWAAPVRIAAAALGGAVLVFLVALGGESIAVMLSRVR